MMFYFDVVNGKCVEPYNSVPRYRATFHNMKLVKLEGRWTKDIYKEAPEIVEEINQSERYDFENNKCLKKSLRQLFWRNLFSKDKKKFSIPDKYSYHIIYK